MKKFASPNSSFIYLSIIYLCYYEFIFNLIYIYVNDLFCLRSPKLFKLYSTHCLNFNFVYFVNNYFTDSKILEIYKSLYGKWIFFNYDIFWISKLHCFSFFLKRQTNVCGRANKLRMISLSIMVYYVMFPWYNYLGILLCSYKVNSY